MCSQTVADKSSLPVDNIFSFVSLIIETQEEQFSKKGSFGKFGP